MGNILEEFWYGNINPQEQSKESSRAIKELLKLMGRNRDRLHDSMTEEQQETLEKYDDCVNEMYGLIELEIFFCAFRLGGRLIHADGQWRRRINGKGHTADIVACCVAFLLVPLEECQPKISFFRLSLC